MPKYFRGGLFEVDKIPYGHDSLLNWGDTAVAEVDDTPEPRNPFEGQDPLETF